MADPLDQLQVRLRQIGGAAPRVRARVVGDLGAAIAQRFASGAAPVQSGALAASVQVTQAGDGVRVASDLPYAQRHPEMLPSEAEITALIQRDADEVIGG